MLTIIRPLKFVDWMLLAICICAQAKNDPSQTNINRAATNTNFLLFTEGICYNHLEGGVRCVLKDPK